MSPSGPRGGLPRSPRARAARQLKAWLADGTLAPGERIPGELALAERLGVARKTVRAALAELVAAGRLDHRGLAGRFAAAPAAPALPAEAAIALITDLSGEFDALPSGALSAIDSGVLLGLDEVARDILLLRLRDFLDPARSVRRLQALAAHPPRVLILGAQGFRLGDDRLRTVIARAQGAGTAVAAYGDEAVLATCDRVVSDHVAGCRLLCEHLFARGVRRIVRCWAPGSGRAWQDGRDRGYELAHAAAGLPPLPHAPPLPGSDDSQAMEVRARLIAAALLGHLGDGPGPVGVLALSDGDCFPIAAAGRLLGRDLQVCGYDAYWRDRSWQLAGNPPPVATIDKQNRLLGRRLAGIVAARLAGTLPPEPQLEVLPPSLVIST